MSIEQNRTRRGEIECKYGTIQTETLEPKTGPTWALISCYVTNCLKSLNCEEMSETMYIKLFNLTFWLSIVSSRIANWKLPMLRLSSNHKQKHTESSLEAQSIGVGYCSAIFNISKSFQTTIFKVSFGLSLPHGCPCSSTVEFLFQFCVYYAATQHSWSTPSVDPSNLFLCVTLFAIFSFSLTMKPRPKTLKYSLLCFWGSLYHY